MEARELLRDLRTIPFTNEALGPLATKVSLDGRLSGIGACRNDILNTIGDRMREVADKKAAHALAVITFQCGIESALALVPMRRV